MGLEAVAPGIVDTPMHANDPHEFLKGLSPMGVISDVAPAPFGAYVPAAQTGNLLFLDGDAAYGGP